MKVEKITYKKCYLKKDVIQFVNSALGVLGPPGAGKSTLCCAYYKTLFNIENQFFEVSTSLLSFTIRYMDSERMKIMRDILDVEGFQLMKLKVGNI